METYKFYVETKIMHKVLPCTVERILPPLISNEQNAFAGVCNISELFRLIADILFQTRTRNIPGLLLPADFSDRLFFVISDSG